MREPACVHSSHCSFFCLLGKREQELTERSDVDLTHNPSQYETILQCVARMQRPKLELFTAVLQVTRYVNFPPFLCIHESICLLLHAMLISLILLGYLNSSFTRLHSRISPRRSQLIHLSISSVSHKCPLPCKPKPLPCHIPCFDQDLFLKNHILWQIFHSLISQCIPSFPFPATLGTMGDHSKVSQDAILR